MLTFGNIFRHKEDYYVHLIETGDVRYVAKILDKEMTKELVRSRDIKSKNPLNRVNEKPLYSFVVLSTESFKEQAAHYGNPAVSPDPNIEVISTLNNEDLELLKNEIINDPAVGKPLGKILADIFKK